MNRRLLSLALLTAMLAGCSGEGNSPIPDAAPSITHSNKCRPTQKLSGEDADLILTDPNTCEKVQIGEVAKAARTHLEQNYEIKVLPPYKGYTLACVTDRGETVYLNGEASAELGFCNRNLFVVTLGGITRLTNGSTAILALWYVIGTESATSRFDNSRQAHCAAAYIAAKRPNATHSADLEFYKELIAGSSWTGTNLPWHFALYGQKLARSGRGIVGCDKPLAEKTP